MISKHGSKASNVMLSQGETTRRMPCFRAHLRHTFIYIHIIYIYICMSDSFNKKKFQLIAIQDVRTIGQKTFI